VRTWITPKDRVQLLLLPREPLFSPCFGPRLVPGTAANVERLLGWFRDSSESRGGQGSMANGVIEALNLLREAADGGGRAGAARYVVIVSDGLDVGDIVAEGVGRWGAGAGDNEQGRALLAGLHLVGVSLTHGPAAEALDRAACGQRGLSFVAAVPPDGAPLADCGVQPRTVTTTDARVPAAPVDTHLLLNSSDLPRLSALPLAPAPPVAWGTPRLLPGARTAVALSRAVFDRRAGANAPPRLTGAVGVDFLLDDVLRAVRDLERPRGIEVRASAGRASSFRRFVAPTRSFELRFAPPRRCDARRNACRSCWCSTRARAAGRVWRTRAPLPTTPTISRRRPRGARPRRRWRRWKAPGLPQARPRCSTR